jgi:hypothetical protein
MLDIQGGSNMTGADCGLFTHKAVPVIFESPCTCQKKGPHSNDQKPRYGGTAGSSFIIHNF